MAAHRKLDQSPRCFARADFVNVLDRHEWVRNTNLLRPIKRAGVNFFTARPNCLASNSAGHPLTSGMNPDEARINRRIEKHRSAMLKTYALARDGKISLSEAHRRMSAGEREYRAIHKMFDRLIATRRSKKKSPKTKVPKQSPPSPKGPRIPWMGRKEDGGKSTYRIG
jgi:hypothetical protein